MTETLTAPVAPSKPEKRAEGCCVIFSRKPLLEAMELAASVVKARTPKPILLCAHIEAIDGKVIVRATDLEMQVRVELAEVQIERTGIALVNADTLRNVLRDSIADRLTLDAGLDEMKVLEQDCVCKLPLGNPSEFPPDAGDVEGVSVTVGLPTIAGILERAAAFTTPNAARFAINGVLMEIGKRKITLAATDGRRLYADTIDKHSDLTATGIIPMGLIAKVGKLTGEEVTITLAENRVIIADDSTSIASNLIEGTFPPYEDIIPKDADKELKVSREELQRALKRAGSFNVEESKGARFDLSKRGMAITTRAPKLGSAEIKIPCKYTGADLTIGLKPQYLADCLKGDSEEITIQFTAADRQILVTDNTNARMVVMPVNLA